MSGTRTVVIDWDNHGLADPSRDVARFIFTLQRTAVELFGSLTALDSVIQVFYKTYTAASGFEVARHLPFYKAAYCLKLPSKRIEATEIMLSEGLRALKEEM